MAGSSVLLRGGKKSTAVMPMSASKRRIWSSTTSANVPTTSRRLPLPCGKIGSTGTMAFKQASSPWVKVVSMPLPE